MTSIITAWLVKLATRILRDKLTDKDDEIEGLLSRLEARSVLVQKLESDLEGRERLNQHREKQTRWLMGQVNQLENQIKEYKDNNQILGDQVENLQAAVKLHHRQLAEQSAMLDKVREERDYIEAMRSNQAATIREYQEERKNLLCSIDTLQANVGGWSKLFDEMKYRMGMSEDRAKLLRRELDGITVQSPSTTGAGSASKTNDSAGGPAGGTANADIG